MEMLNAYLRDLLLLHDCVILPSFGGFVGNYQSARKTDQDYFTPPRKAIAFNSQLRHNDGLLANTIVAIENISYEKAIKRIEAFTQNIEKQLNATGSYTIPSVGKLEKKGTQDQILFTPDATTNFLLSPVGMETFHMMPLAHTQKTLETATVATATPNGRSIAFPILRRALVAGVSGFALLSLLLNPGEFQNLTLSSIAPTSLQEQVSELPSTKKQPTTLTFEQAATIATPEATPKAVTVIKKYHVIVGCFTKKENAQLQKEQLATQSIHTTVFPYSNSLTGVSAGSFETFEQAKVVMNDLRHTGKASSAWVLKRVLN